MAEQTEHGHEPEAPAEPGHEGTDDERLSRIETTLAEVIDFIKGGSPTRADPEPEAPDIKAEVRAAVREVRAKEKADAAKAEEAQSIQDQLTELKAAVEKPPFEYRRVTNVMGWAKP